ncbi:MAG: hypothetical protein IKA64_03835 [Clostridia bacterium]|nr:hypothetical protein [Clostridia bacterium]
MSFFKNNSYDIVRLWINQIGIAIFTLMLYTAVGFVEFDNDTTAVAVKAGVSVFCIAFYFFLIYNVCWECGAKDKIRIDGGKQGATPLRGALMSLFANLPNFVLAGLCLIFVLVYLLSSLGGFYTAFGVVNLILRFHSSLYLGVIQAVTPIADVPVDFLVESALYLILPLLSVLVSHIAYTLGSREKRLFASKK